MNLVKSSLENMFFKPKNFSVIFNEACNRNLVDRGGLMSSVCAVSDKRQKQRKKENDKKLASNIDANAVHFLNIDFIS